MSYTPHTWVDNETITAAKLNNIEDGIQEGGGGGGALIVETDDPFAEAGASGAMDKTFEEIYTALRNGTPVFIKTGSETSGPSSDYSCGMAMLPILCAFKYDNEYKVYVGEKVLWRVAGDYYAGAPAITTFSASSPSGYPSYSNCVVPTQLTDLND